MIALDDQRWSGLLGGYRIPYDPRGALYSLTEGKNTEAAWKELWNELYHQGDVGEASYAAMPHLVRIHSNRRPADWNTYALFAAIETARWSPQNPQLPSWLCAPYNNALDDLFALGLDELKGAQSPELINGIMAILAIGKEQQMLARFALDFSEEERGDILNLAGSADS